MTPEPPKQPKPPCDHIEPIIWLLFFGAAFFAVLMVLVSKWSPDDAQTFTVLSMLASGFASSLWTRVKPGGKPPEDSR